eukprot:844872-Amorphochlora_amoeboformis.AAC.1
MSIVTQNKGINASYRSYHLQIVPRSRPSGACPKEATTSQEHGRGSNMTTDVDDMLKEAGAPSAGGSVVNLTEKQ